MARLSAVCKVKVSIRGGSESAQSKCVTAGDLVGDACERHCSTPAVGPRDRRAHTSGQGTCASAAQGGATIGPATQGTLEWRAEQLRVEPIVTFVPTDAAPLLEPVAMSRALHRSEELMHNAVISVRHAARAVAQVAMLTPTEN